MTNSLRNEIRYNKNNINELLDYKKALPTLLDRLVTDIDDIKLRFNL